MIEWVALTVALINAVITIIFFKIGYRIYRNYRKAFTVIENFSHQRKMEKALLRRISRDIVENEPILRILSEFFPETADFLAKNPEAIPVALGLLRKFNLDKESIIRKFLEQSGTDINISELMSMYGETYGKAEKEEEQEE